MTDHGVVIPNEKKPVVERLPDPEPFPELTPNAKRVSEIMSKAADRCTIRVAENTYQLTQVEQPVIPVPPEPCAVEIVWTWEGRLAVTLTVQNIAPTRFARDGKAITLTTSRDCIAYDLAEELRVNDDPVLEPSPALVIVVLRYESAVEPATLTVPRGILR